MVRYVFGFLCVCALGVMPLVGCSETQPECQSAEDCSDGNECTEDTCTDGTCDSVPVQDGSNRRSWTGCDFDGFESITGYEDGICVAGVCEESPCDDGNDCTQDPPPAPDGSCKSDPIPCTYCYPCDWNGEPGFCIEGECEEDPCNSAVCDDGNLCTDDSCWFGVCTFLRRCDDRNACTQDICDLETGECSYIPTDGRSCCLEWGCRDFLCYDRYCTDPGHCQNGVCVG